MAHCDNKVRVRNCASYVEAWTYSDLKVNFVLKDFSPYTGELTHSDHKI